jgi:hypothetical protein
MRKFDIIAVLLLLMTSVLFTGCELVGDIFRAGIWVGVLGVVALVALVIWVIGKVK